MLSLLSLGVVTIATATQFNTEVKQQSFLKSIEYQHRLRVCNAYPGSEVFRVEKAGQNLTKNGASLAYKECQEAHMREPLKAGDRLSFFADTLPMGSFTIDALPQYDAMLYIVVQRHDERSDAVAFQSHLFAAARNAQVAVMDTYVGKAKAALLLANATGEGGASKGGIQSYTVMPFGTAFGVADGNYQVILSDGSADSKIRSPLQTRQGESYLVLRTGVGLAGKGSEMNLMVFPSPSWADKSGVPKASVWNLSAVFLAVLALLF